MEQLQNLGYTYSDGFLVSVDTGERFTRTPKDNYDAIGEAINVYLAQQLVEVGLKKVQIPLDADSPYGAKMSVFVSENWREADKKLLIICGEGAARPGVWSRYLCINDSLDHGSMMPYINAAIAESYGILIANPNQNRDPITKQVVSFNETMEDHLFYLWTRFVMPFLGQTYILGYSVGGYGAMHLLQKFPEDFGNRVAAVATIESSHSTPEPEIADIVSNKFVNWTHNTEEINTPVQITNGAVNLSSGHEKFAGGAGNLCPVIFEYFRQMDENVNMFRNIS